MADLRDRRRRDAASEMDAICLSIIITSSLGSVGTASDIDGGGTRNIFDLST